MTDILYHALLTLGVPTTLPSPFRSVEQTYDSLSACTHYLTILAPTLAGLTLSSVSRERMLSRARENEIPTLIVWAYGDHSGPPRWLQRLTEKSNNIQVVTMTAPDDIDTVLVAVCEMLGVHPRGWTPPRWHLSAIQREHLHAEAKLANIFGGRQDKLQGLDALCAAHPTFAFGFGKRGYVRLKLRKHIAEERAASLADYSRAIELRPDIPSYYAARADLQTDTAAKLADIDRALALAPDGASYYSRRGDYNAQAANHEAAVMDYTAALRLRPKNADDRERRAEQYMALGMHRAALYDMYHLAAFGSRNLKMNYVCRAADMLRIAGHHEAAHTTLHNAFDFYETNIRWIRGAFIRRISRLFVTLGDVDAALACYDTHIERVHSRQPKRLYKALLARGDFKRKFLRDLDAAFADYDAALVEAGQSKIKQAIVHRHRGRMYVALRDWPAACREYDLSIQLRRRLDYRDQKWRALARARANDLDGARADAEAVLQHHPSTLGTRLLVEWLDRQATDGD